MKAFTLIELLIVVAIIAILAAIAVPNFLEAQTRAKVTRTEADMRSVAVALEAYAVDHNVYVLDKLERQAAGATAFEVGTLEILQPLTTPIAYLSSLTATADIFRRQEPFNSLLPGSLGYFIYRNRWLPGDGAVSSDGNYISVEGTLMNWILISFGPDKESSAINMGLPMDFFPISARYDPTNGTISTGDVGRFQ